MTSVSPIAGTDQPIADRKSAYDRAFTLFNQAYGALEPLFGELVAMQREMAD